MRVSKWAGRAAALVVALVAVNAARIANTEIGSLRWQGIVDAQEHGVSDAGRTVAERRLLYVASPGATGSENGIGILVFDVNRNFRFVKRIPTFDYPAGMDPCCEFGSVLFGEEVRGLAANAATGMLFVSTGRRLAAFSLLTD